MSRPSRFGFVLLLCGSLLSGASGCSKSPRAPVQATNVQPKPAPDGLLMTASIASVEKGIGRMAAFVNGIQPGAGALLQGSMVPGMIAGLVKADSLDGANLGKATRLLVLDPKAHSAPHVALVAVADEKQLKASAGSASVSVQDGWALIGEKASIDVVAAYAFSTLARERAPEDLTLVLHVKPFLATYRSDIEEFRRSMAQIFQTQSPAAGQILDAEVAFVMSMLEQTDRVVVTLEAATDRVDLDIAMVPFENTPFYAFTRAQKPSDGHLLSRLPAQESPMVMAGHFEAGPFRGPLIAWVAKFFKSTTGSGAFPEKELNEYLDLFTGEMAATMSYDADGRLHMDELFTLTDAPKAMKLMRSLYAATLAGPVTADFMGLKMTIAANFEEGTHDGVPVASMSMKLDYGTTLPEAQRQLMERTYGPEFKIYFATFDDVLALSIGSGGLASMGRVIDAARGKGRTLVTTGATRAALQAAARRKESMMAFMDLIAFMKNVLPMLGDRAGAPSQSGFEMGFGFADGAAHMRIGVPAAHIRELQGLTRGM